MNRTEYERTFSKADIEVLMTINRKHLAACEERIEKWKLWCNEEQQTVAFLKADQNKWRLLLDTNKGQ